MREAARNAPKVKKPSERGSTALSRCSMRSRNTCARRDRVRGMVGGGGRVRIRVGARVKVRVKVRVGVRVQGAPAVPSC